MNITILNQYPDLELISPVYFSNSTTCRTPPNQQIGIGNALVANFGIDFKQKDVKGAVLYKLLRKYAIRTDNRHDNSTASTDNTTTNMYLLMAWDIKNYDYRFHVCLIECACDFAWDEDKLWALYKEYSDQFCKDYVSDIVTWLMYDSTIMETRYNVTYGLGHKLDIVISKGTRNDSMKKPMQIDPKRSVLLFSMSIVLICTISLPIQPSVKLNIYNQCLNVDLVSPTYITGYRSECHRPPDYKVCVGDTTRYSFIIKSNYATGGALIYKLQRKHMHKSTKIGKYTSRATHLLVVWEFSSSRVLYVDVILVRHDKRLDKDDLKCLYRENFDRFRLCSDFATELWSLDDNTVLRTTFEIMNEDHLSTIIISEVEGDNGARMPAHIYLRR
jgi:hypothetical protein